MVQRAANEDETAVTITVKEGEVRSQLEAAGGMRLLDILRQYGKGIAAPCGGRGTCGKCRVEIAGEGSQLACQYAVEHDIEVVLPEARRAAILHDSTLDIPPTEYDAGLRTVALHDGGARLYYRDIPLCVFGAGHAPTVYGAAVDIGTTTTVIYLADLTTHTAIDVESFVNPQTQYGYDVVSRIQYATQSVGGLDELRGLVVRMLSEKLVTMCSRHGVDPMRVVKMAVVGNPTMLHILAGVPPASIATAPYTPVFTERKTLSAGDIGVGMCPEGAVVLLPSVSGYVGADIVAGIATTALRHSDTPALFIDIGTNGEMALGNRHELWCCSTAAGPAFEGANIWCGVGGVRGAISRYSAEGYRTIGDSEPVGICGSGLIDIVAYLLDNGVIDPTGYMEQDFVVAKAEDTAIGSDIVLTPQDVRQVQLAKSAIVAGIKVLLEHAGIGLEQVGAMYIGGAFGNFMPPESARRVGLIPHELRERVVLTGNVAGRGALTALLSTAFGDRIDSVASAAEYIELSMHAGFNEHFVMHMGFEAQG